MFKRLFWLTIGASLGVGTSWWVTRTVRQKIERYAPTRLTAGVANKARTVGGDVRAAVADGRQAMHDHEELLRAQLDARYAPRDR
ncbi:MAG: hypothetical protein QOF30_1187 [Acidimicrobiaceae bacterium]|nr:hypothetical protein [Acidimicrobiaceae bacterium]